MSHETIPTFVVAGAARCGTTGLVEGLRSHPQVFVTEPKEPHYLAFHGQTADFSGPGDANTINRVAVTERSDYLALYPHSHDYLALGDGSVSTFYYQERAIPEALRINPDMRFVLLLREPVARAYSSFQYMRARGFEPLENFLAAVAEEPARRRSNYHHLWHYTQMSYYAKSLAGMHALVGRERLGVWFHDELEDDYEATVSSVLRFLDLPITGGEAEGVPRVNISGTPRSRALQRTIWAATRNEPLRRGVKRVTSYRFREGVRRLALRRSAVPGEVYSSLAPRFQTDLSEVREILQELVPRPLPSWLSELSPPKGHS